MRHFPLSTCALIVFCLAGHASADAGDIFVGDGEAQLVLSEHAGEGPAWDHKLGLLFSGHGSIMRMARDGSVDFHRQGAGTNGLLFDKDGSLLACEPALRRVTRTNTAGKLKVLAEDYDGMPFNQPNDITVDSKGRIYFSDPQYGERSKMKMLDAEGRQVEGVYRIDPDGKVTRVITHEVDRPNGLVVTPDDRFLFVADNNNNEVGGARKLWRFAMKSNGSVDLASRTLLYDWGNSRGPDGMVLDAAGRVYVAGGINKPNPPNETDEKLGGVYVFSSEGKLLAFVRVPRDEVTNCTFGGEDLKTLFVTAGGTLWSVRTTTPGQLLWPRR
ncbi:MAG: SMP-30/gluconolactonase/LRE family protein [Planctomycetes bacterium]|nr:SMP-30/gluconolactonase/LRE family protein [Planctomycetota bacterium]